MRKQKRGASTEPLARFTGRLHSSRRQEALDVSLLGSRNHQKCCQLPLTELLAPDVRPSYVTGTSKRLVVLRGSLDRSSAVVHVLTKRFTFRSSKSNSSIAE
jgi:hypothetical protein